MSWERRMPANGRAQAEPGRGTAVEGTALALGVHDARRRAGQPRDRRGKAQPGILSVARLADGHRKRKVHAWHLQALHLERHLPLRIYGTAFLFWIANW